MSSPSFPSLGANPVDHARTLGELCETGQHHFWPDDISPRDFLIGNIRLTAAQITDVYQLALAVKHGGKLATFDQRIPAHIIPGGIDALEVIPT